MVKPMSDPNGPGNPAPASLDSEQLTALVRGQLRRAYRILATWQPGDEKWSVVWATGVMEAQHADPLSRFWHTGHHSALHGPWGMHNLGDGRLFDYDQQRAAITDRDDTVIVTVPWTEVGALLEGVDSDLRFACDEALAIHDLLTDSQSRGAIWRAARAVGRWRCFQVAAVVWEAVYLQSVAGACAEATQLRWWRERHRMSDGTVVGWPLRCAGCGDVVDPDYPTDAAGDARGPVLAAVRRPRLALRGVPT